MWTILCIINVLCDGKVSNSDSRNIIASLFVEIAIVCAGAVLVTILIIFCMFLSTNSKHERA